MNLQALDDNKELHERLERAYEMLEALEERSGLQAVSMDGMPHGTDVSDKVGNIAVAKADLEKRITEMEDELEMTDREVREFANSFKDERLQQIIQHRYISCFTWSEVADLLGPKFTGDSVRRLVYRMVSDG